MKSLQKTLETENWTFCFEEGLPRINFPGNFCLMLASGIVGNRTQNRSLVSGYSINSEEIKMAIWMIFLACYLAFIILFMAIPASLGFSFGIRNLYLATLYKVFEVSFNYDVANRSLIVHRIEDYLYSTAICKDLF